MEKVLEFIKGKKTYAVAVTILVLAVLRWRGIELPAEVWMALNALGLGFLRAGVKDAQKAGEDWPGEDE